MISHLLHIRPWEIDLLTVRQWQRAVAWCEEHIQRQKEAAGV